MAMPIRKPTPEQRKEFADSLENLVWGLFGKQVIPFFDKGSVSLDLLDDFARSDEVFDASFEYASNLMSLWKKKYPGKKIRPYVKPRQPLTDALLVTSPELASIGNGTQTMTQNDASLPPDAQNHATSTTKPPLSPGQVPASGAQANKPASPTASFHLPNAKFGIPYSSKIEGTDSTGKSVSILDIKIPPEIGLSFDPSTGVLSGAPTAAGDFKLALLWSSETSASQSGSCLLIVNPDPRSLWKVIEPPADAPYAKPHTDKKIIKTPDYKIMAASRRGRSHEHSGSFRDDEFYIRHLDTNGWNVIIVADGAGGSKYSRQGSKLAVETAGAHLVENLSAELGEKMSLALKDWDADPETTGKTMGGEFHYLFHKASTLAVQAIEQEALSMGSIPKEFSTTLLAAAVKRQGDDTFLATFWMGDGAIAAYGPRGKVRLMGTPDGGEYAGQTRFLDRASLTDQGFSKRIGVGRYPDITAVLLMTDGVSDPRFETDNGLLDASKWDSLWDDLSPTLASPDPEQGLVDWLHFFTQGHHDDRTIALLW